jgi:guanyl-specific ribonuclease Sa
VIQNAVSNIIHGFNDFAADPLGGIGRAFINLGSVIQEAHDRIWSGDPFVAGQTVGDIGITTAAIASIVLHPGAAAADATRTTTDFLSGVTVESRGVVIGTGTRDLRQILSDIATGRAPIRDTFMNEGQRLPVKPSGYYHEYAMTTPGFSGTGPERIVKGQNGELYYTPDHYKTFIPINGYPLGPGQ